MKNCCRVILIALTIFTMLAPHIADARAGGGRSSGSMGSRTYRSSPQAAPIQRSITPQKPTSPQNFNQPQTFNQQPPAFSGGSPFLRGLAGGFLGAGIASMLFGHSGNAAAIAPGGASGAGSMMGGFLQILLIGGLIYFAIRMFRGNRGANNAFSMNNFNNNFSSENYAQNMADNSSPLNITDSDKEYFEQLLQKIQHSWSEGDVARLRQCVTPEMLQYFSEELSANASRGLANKVENVTLEKADITQSWSEFGLDYATARLQWSANDYMVRLDKNHGDKDYVAEGNNNQLSNAEEFWTFVRSSSGNWLLSAIQQVG